jgi:hypothetical protein
MFDVRLISLLPPAQVVSQPPVIPGVTQVSAPTSVTTQGSGVLAQLPTGSVLSGFIINRDATGNPILRTDKGDVLFASNFFLKIGSEVVIRVQNNAGQHNAHIVTVNGVPPEVAETQSGFADEGEIVVTGRQQSPQQQTSGNTNTTAERAAAPATLPPALKPGQTISAILVTPALPEKASPGLQPGTSLLLNVLPKDSPQKQASASSALSQLTSDTRVAALPNSSSNALSNLLPQAQTPPLDSPLSKILSTPVNPAIAPPQNNFSSPQSATSSLIGQTTPYTTSNQQAAGAKFTGPLGQTITATVIAQGNDDSVLFDSPIGTLRVANIGTVPRGEQITLRVSSVATPNSYTIAVANQATPAPLASLTQLSRNWPSLSQIAQLLGEETVSQIIPNFTATFAPDSAGRSAAQAGSQILFFIAALKGGSFRDWLGNQHVHALEDKGYGGLIKKAEGEFMQIARQFSETQPNNWQSAYFPVIASGELQQVRAFIKRERKKDENGKPTGGEDTRFVVEMELSQLGEMQMDGLVKRRENTLQFDLVIRSIYPLPTELEQDIRQIYASTAELTGYQGQLAFQSGPAFPVHPLEDTTPHVFDDIVI